MPFNMAWFKAQEEKKKAEELAKKKAENPDFVESEKLENTELSTTKEGSRLL